MRLCHYHSYTILLRTAYTSMRPGSSRQYKSCK